MISLLFETPAPIPHIDEQLRDDLLLESIFSGVIPDEGKRSIFLAVLTNPLTDAAEIRYRAEILRDFTAAPNLIEAVRHELDALSALHDTAQRNRSHAYTLAKKELSVLTARELVMIGADTAVKALHILTQLHTVIGMYMACSAGLTRLGERLSDFCALHADAEFQEICAGLIRYGYAGETLPDIRFAITEDGRIGGCELAGLHAAPAQEKEKASMLKKLFTPKNAPSSDPAVTVSDPFDEIKKHLLTQSLSRAFELLDALTRQMFDEILPLARELSFYEAACAYVKSFRSKRVPLAVPVIAGDTRIDRLYDLLLCTQRLTPAEIIPHDIRLTAGMGILLTGENNSGKTVYMRSVGCAQLLFQAGLPVPAEAAQMRIFSAVRTGYAAAEKEFAAGNEAGRFEQEVRAMAELISSLRPDSLLLMNEIFQSTSYAEGADGLYHILRYLMSRGTGYILVTHLRELLPMLRGSVVHLQTGAQYTVSPADESNR